MKCSKCGFDNKDGSKFCLKCGNRLSEEVQNDICFEKQKIPDENNVGTESSDTGVTISKESEQTASVIIDPPHKNINKILVIALSAAAVIIISAAAVGILSKNNDDEVPSVSVTETETQTTLTEAVTSATTAKTTVTTKQTTRATTTTTAATTTTQAETIPLRSNEAHFSLSCGTIDFVDNNEIYKFIGDYWDEYYILNYQLTPHVNLTNSEASAKIENELTMLLSSPSIGASEDFISVYSLPNDFYSKDNIEYEKRIESVYEENGILFISILDYLNDEFDDYTYVIVNGYIFDLSYGEQYSFFDFVTDKDKFENAVNEYIQNHVYFAEYNNNWVYGNMRYDGENLYINYQEYTVDIPAYVWRDYVDFSVSERGFGGNTASVAGKSKLSDIVGPGPGEYSPTPDKEVDVTLADISNEDRKKIIDDLKFSLGMYAAINGTDQSIFIDESNLIYINPNDDFDPVYYYNTGYNNKEEIYNEARKCFSENFISDRELYEGIVSEGWRFDEYKGKIVWRYVSPTPGEGIYDFDNAGIVSYTETTAEIWIAQENRVQQDFWLLVFNMERDNSQSRWKIAYVYRLG